MIGDCFGPMARARVNDIHSDHLPVILIVSKVQGSVDVRNIIQGLGRKLLTLLIFLYGLFFHLSNIYLQEGRIIYSGGVYYCWLLIMYTVELLNNLHIGTSHFPSYLWRLKCREGTSNLCLLYK